MNELSPFTIEVLNRLYQTEMHTLLPRLNELSLAVSRRHPNEGDLLRRVAQEAHEHREWLIDEIESHRGSVWPATLDIRSAAAHYISADTVLPQVQQSLGRLIESYARASSERDLASSARDLVRRISRRYETMRDEIQRSTAKPAPAQPAAAV